MFLLGGPTAVTLTSGLCVQCLYIHTGEKCLEGEGPAVFRSAAQRSHPNCDYPQPQPQPTFLSSPFKFRKASGRFNDTPEKCHVLIAASRWKAHLIQVGDWSPPIRCMAWHVPEEGMVLVFHAWGDISDGPRGKRSPKCHRASRALQWM